MQDKKILIWSNFLLKVFCNYNYCLVFLIYLAYLSRFWVIETYVMNVDFIYYKGSLISSFV